MNRAVRLTAAVIGAYAGLLAAVHGGFELQQGAAAPDGVMIYAIGAPCQPEAVWHACLPALTVLPSFQIAGIVVLILAAGVIAWAAAGVGRRRGGIVLIGLALALLLAGGGFFPFFFAVIAGLVGTRIHAPLDWWRGRLAGRAGSALAAFWPWALGLFLAWSAAQWLVGDPLADALPEAVSFIIDFGLLALGAFGGIARDARQPDEKEQAT